jgi:hypothetical protein
MFVFPYEFFPYEHRDLALRLLPGLRKAILWCDRHGSKYPEHMSDYDLCRSIITYRRFIEMAARKKNSSTPSDKRAGKDTRPVTWVNARLDDDDVAWIIENCATDEMLAAGFLSLTRLSVNLYIRFVPGQGAFTAGMISEHPTEANSLVGLSGWGDTAEDAIASLLGKWYSALGGAWGDVKPAAERRFR